MAITEKTRHRMVDDVKDTNVGASFNMGFMTLMGSTHEYKAGFDQHRSTTWLGVTVPLGAGTLKATYSMTEFVKPIDRPTRPKSPSVMCMTCPSAPPSTCTLRSRQRRRPALRRWRRRQGNGVGGFKSTGYEVGVRHSF
jgi:hypothetical protein